MPEKGLIVVKRLSIKQNDTETGFDLKRHIDEILSGVKRANEKYSGSLEVQEIEIVPNDYPKRGQAMSAAYEIAEYILTKNI